LLRKVRGAKVEMCALICALVTLLVVIGLGGTHGTEERRTDGENQAARQGAAVL
jgi:hypothetical protein